MIKNIRMIEESIFLNFLILVIIMCVSGCFSHNEFPKDEKIIVFYEQNKTVLDNMSLILKENNIGNVRIDNSGYLDIFDNQKPLVAEDYLMVLNSLRVMPEIIYASHRGIEMEKWPLGIKGCTQVFYGYYSSGMAFSSGISKGLSRLYGDCAGELDYQDSLDSSVVYSSSLRTQWFFKKIDDDWAVALRLSGFNPELRGREIQLGTNR